MLSQRLLCPAKSSYSPFTSLSFGYRQQVNSFPLFYFLPQIPPQANFLRKQLTSLDHFKLIIGLSSSDASVLSLCSSLACDQDLLWHHRSSDKSIYPCEHFADDLSFQYVGGSLGIVAGISSRSHAFHWELEFWSHVLLRLLFVQCLLRCYDHERLRNIRISTQAYLDSGAK